MQTLKTPPNNFSSQAFLSKGAMTLTSSKLKTNHRSNSEVKNVSNEPKPNYHYLQPREVSEDKNSAKVTQNKSKHHFQIKKLNESSVEENKGKQIEFKLPDLKLYQKPPKPTDQQSQQPSTVKNTSLLQQQQNQLRNRLNMYDTKTSTMSASKMPKIHLQKSEQQPKLQLQSAALSKAGFDGFAQKENQDREFVYCPIEGKYDQGAFGIFDGHGQEGDKVSQFLLETLRVMLQKQFQDFDFKWAFQELHSLVVQHPNIGSHFSGSTMSLCLIKNNQINCGWVGDSRAVLCRRNKSKRPLMIEAVELSKDHKPNLPEEKLRIEASGGMVDSYHGPSGQQLGPHRVWVKGMPYPGLAMSRSIGDQVAASVGVSQIPDVNILDITPDDLFMIVASDGVWEFISSQQGVEIVYPFFLKNDPQGACQKLYAESFQIWKQFDDGIDDITSVVVFFNRESQ